MWFKTLNRLADHSESGSLSSRFRNRRFGLFRSLLGALPRPLRILDVGGTQRFWENVGFVNEPGIEIILVNRNPMEATRDNFSSITCNATDLSMFGDNEFDIVFSNSAIEHQESFEKQAAMAAGMARVGKRYFVQTPNLWFPVEPHFLFPLFHFLPVFIRVWLVCSFKIGPYKKFGDRKEAEEVVRKIRLLSLSKFRKLFPGAEIRREKFYFLTKSFIAFKWD